jgi:hypothetical protein
MALGGLSAFASFSTTARAQDRIMGQVRFIASSRAMNSSGVWVDGEYVGFLKELRGMNRLRLLPGNHEIVIRQAGFVDLTRKVVIEPRSVLDVNVNMDKDPRFTYPNPKTSSEVRLNITPARAAVFVDETYIGSVEEYYGVGHAMLVSPGKHRFTIALPGYKTFEAEVSLLPRQKFELRTHLIGGSINDAAPIIRSDGTRTSSSAGQGTASAAR